MNIIKIINSSPLFRSSLKKNINLFMWLLLIFILGSFLSVYPTKLLGDIINLLSTEESISAVKKVILMYVFIRIISLSITILGKYLQEYISSNLECELRIKSVDETINMDMAEFEKIQSTQFVSRIFEAISQLVSAIINIITWLGKSLTTLIFTFYFLFKIDAEITLAFIPLIPCMAILTKIISSKKKALSKKEAEKSGFVKDFIQEIVSSFKEIKVYNCSKWVFGKYDDLENQWKNARIKSNFLSSAVFWLLSFFGIVVVSVILILAINKTLSHELNPGDITAMILYSGTIFNGVMEVFNQIIVFKNLEVVTERYNEVMKNTYSNKIYNENLLWNNSTYDIDVSNVNFAFDKPKNILENINFKIPFGSSVAIIGQSGSGKSTLLKLLLGLYIPTKGKVKIGGINISDMSNEDRCKLITCAFQDTFIYNSSIYDNIVLGKNITNELFTNSLAMSDLFNFICELVLD